MTLVQEEIICSFARIRSECTNEEGYVRLSRVRSRGFNLNSREERIVLGHIYGEWVCDDLYVVLEKVGAPNPIVQAWKDPEVKREYHVSKARKRGNDVDVHRIDRQMTRLKDALMPYCWPKSTIDMLQECNESCSRQRHDNVMRKIRRESSGQTRLIYITGTVDHAFFDWDSQWAWDALSACFNRMLANLRKRCGTVLVDVNQDGELVSKRKDCSIYVLRSWEAHENGWPHFHAILAFEDFDWGIFQHLDKDGKTRWRVKRADIIEDAWDMGFVDVQALTAQTLEHGLENVLWYVSKTHSDQDYRLIESWPEKRLLTQSILWYLRKRSYAVSRSLLREPDDLIGRFCITKTEQRDLEGRKLEIEFIRWEFIGLVRREDTELSSEDWFKLYKEPPDWLDKCWKPRASKQGLGWTSSWLTGGA